MHRPQPDKLHDELDALLDGRPVELTDELAPLVEAADALRGELAAYQLEPEVADRHLERVLGSPANVVPMPTRPQPSGWEVRRRIVAVVLAAALVLVPATVASAAALPGQPMYPFKLAIEQVRLAAVQWSPAREAGERTRVAHVRLSEVEDLYHLQMYSQLPTAIRALNQAVAEAQRAVEEAQHEGEAVPSVAFKLIQVKQNGYQVLQKVFVTAATGTANGLLTNETAQEIQAAVQAAPAVSPPSTATPPTTAPKRGGAGAGTAPPTQPTSTAPSGQGPGTTSPPSQTTSPPPTSPETSTSEAPPTTAQTTTAPPTSTEAPPSTDVNPTLGSIGDDGGATGQAGAGDTAPLGYAPPTTLPPAPTP
jgi:Domain of unknown function (DUF5667)